MKTKLLAMAMIASGIAMQCEVETHASQFRQIRGTGVVVMAVTLAALITLSGACVIWNNCRKDHFFEEFIVLLGAYFLMVAAFAFLALLFVEYTVSMTGHIFPRNPGVPALLASIGVVIYAMASNKSNATSPETKRDQV